MVEAVVSAAEQSDHLAGLGIGLSQALHWFLMPRGHFSDQQVLQTLSILVARRMGDPATEAWRLGNLADLFEEKGQYAEACSSSASALAIWQRLGDRDGEQRCLCNLANSLISSGQDYEEAVELLSRQIAIAREIGNNVAAMIGAATLGKAYSKLGRIDDALRSMRECADSARALGDIRMLGETLCEIGIVHLG